MKNIEEIMGDSELTRLMLHAFHSILFDTDAMLFVKDHNLVYQAANMPFVRMVGKTRPEEVIDHSDSDLFDDPILAQRYIADDHRLFEEERDAISYIEPLPEVKGRARFARTSKYILRNPDGEVIGLAGISRDVTQEIVASEDHQKEISYLFNLPDNAFMAVYLDVTDWRIIGERQQEIDRRSFRMHESADSFVHQARRYIVNSGDPAYAFYGSFRPDTLEEIYKSGRRNIVLEYLRRFSNGEERWVSDEINLLVDPANNHLCLMLTVRDIHTRKQEEVNLLWVAERDDMTGILNRASVIKYIKDFLSKDGQNSSHALFVIDIDNFKSVNDTLGHHTGDQFLAHIAQTIRSSFRDSDLVGRLGGDEFLVLMKNITSNRIVRGKGESLLAALQRVCREKSGLNVSASIGISLFRQDGKTFEELYEKADQAMYASKRSGKGKMFLTGDVSNQDSVCAP